MRERSFITRSSKSRKCLRKLRLPRRQVQPLLTNLNKNRLSLKKQNAFRNQTQGVRSKKRRVVADQLSITKYIYVTFLDVKF